LPDALRRGRRFKEAAFMADVDSQGLFWLYQTPNLLLAALMYTLLGRFVLSLFFPDDSDKVIYKVFRQVTQPAIAAVQLVTPAAVHARVVVLLAVVWVLFARLVLFVGFAALGWLPSIVGAPS
jgi:YggT family protein